MAHAQPSILLVTTFYPEFLDATYAADPALAACEFDEQSQRLIGTDFGVVDAYCAGLRALGCDARAVVVNADRLQECWAREHGLRLDANRHLRRRQILAAQIDHHRPDVLLVFEWSPLGDVFLSYIQPRVRLLVTQLASHLPDNRTFESYDLALSSWPPLVEHFRANGLRAERFRLGFDERVLERLSLDGKRFDVTFVGGLGPAHENRVRWLERLLREIDVDVFGYGCERTDGESVIRSHHCGACWGTRMFEVLAQSRITLNLHGSIRIRGREVTSFANNMRLYEATGVGTCLLTDAKDDLSATFEPGREVLTFQSDAECIEKVRYYLEHEEERAAIAAAGQRRTLEDHTYGGRMEELLEILEKHLARKGRGAARLARV